MTWRRELVERLVSRRPHPRPGEDPLIGLIERIERIERKTNTAGLTDEIVDAERAAAKKSRRRANPCHRTFSAVPHSSAKGCQK